MSLPRKVYRSRGEEITDFVIGFVGWIVVNAVMFGLAQLAGIFGVDVLTRMPMDADTETMVYGIMALAVNCLPLVVNIMGLTILAFVRRWMALGALAAFAATLLLVLCAALLVAGFCFFILAQYQAF